MMWVGLLRLTSGAPVYSECCGLIELPLGAAEAVDDGAALLGGEWGELR